MPSRAGCSVTETGLLHRATGMRTRLRARPDPSPRPRSEPAQQFQSLHSLAWPRRWSRLGRGRRGGLRRRDDAIAMRHAGPDIAEQALGLRIARFRIVAAPLDVHRRPFVPRLERVGIVLAHLLFRRKTIGKFVEHQVSVDGRHSADQNHKHPFHDFHTLSPFAERTSRLLGSGREPGFTSGGEACRDLREATARQPLSMPSPCLIALAALIGIAGRSGPLTSSQAPQKAAFTAAK